MQVKLSWNGGTPKGIQRLKQRFPAAIARAINRSADSAKTAMVRVIATDMGMKVSDVRRYVSVSEATSGHQVATIRASAKPIPLIQFGAKGREPSRGKGRGVTARLKGGAGRYPKAFIATMASGHRGVFQRVPGARRHGGPPHRSQLPIYELKGPSVWHVFNNNLAIGLARAQEQLIKNLRSELKYALSKA